MMTYTSTPELLKTAIAVPTAGSDAAKTTGQAGATQTSSQAGPEYTGAGNSMFPGAAVALPFGVGIAALFA